MVKDFFRNYIYPITTLSGSIIGVGFLSLPYITLKVGVLPMLFYFIALTVLVVIMHVIFGQISLKTPDFKRWPGFIGFYFGESAKKIILIVMSLGSFGVLVVYLIVGGEFLTALFSPIFGGTLFHYLLFYFIVLSLIVYFGINVVSKLEFLAIISLLCLLFLIFIRAFSNINLGNFFLSTSYSGDWKNMVMPYGAIIFSLWGIGLIPEVEEMVRGRKKSLKKILIIGTLVPAVIYLLFIFLVLGITGTATTESALIGIKNMLGNGVTSAMLCIGIITTFTAFIAQGLLLKKVFIYDAKMHHFPAWVFTCFTPLVIFLLGFNSFIAIISLVGGVLLGIDGILILLMYRKIGGKKRVVYPLTLVFILGMVYSIIYFV